MRRCFLIWGLIISLHSIYGQIPIGIKINDSVVCYGKKENNPINIPPPVEYLRWKNHSVGRIKNSTIEVSYNGFESVPQALIAFQTAVNILESIISSPVTIRIEAHWKPLDIGVLASASYTWAFANFKGAQKLNVFYPVALAEKIAGEELNFERPDIVTNFNSNVYWHFDPNTEPPPDEYDLTTVVLHEICHGLGFAATFNSIGSSGQVGFLGTGLPIIYDVPIVNGNNGNLIESFISPSEDLWAQLKSRDLFFDSPTSGKPELYAPNPFNPGSSISHLDDGVFDNTPNSLMTHSIAFQERMHDLGIAKNVLNDIGWETLKIKHQPLPDAEDVSGPFTITANVEDENGYVSSLVKLNYTIDGTSYTQINMSPTGVSNEFSGTIPSTGGAQIYGYFISVTDNSSREFVNPGKIVTINKPQEQKLFIFETGPDIKAPKISHSPKSYLLESDTQLIINTKVTDNIGIAYVKVEYTINDSPQPQQFLELSSPQDSIYTVTLDLGTLSSDDVIKYQIKAVDSSISGNQTVSPSTGFYLINTAGLMPPQDSYQNDFNNSSNDFFGNGFSIATPSEFMNGAIHSQHPYLEGNGLTGGKNELIYQLRIPIRIAEHATNFSFDEIVLVEPGEEGSHFGDDNFYDYVILEGSKDGGITWIPLDYGGYDSRVYYRWSNRYYSSTSGSNSTAIGDPGLFRQHTSNLLLWFNKGDEVLFRFRLYSDEYAVGWGWAIDNLKIQIPDSLTVLHDHADFLIAGEDMLTLNSKVWASNIKEFKIEYFINNGSTETRIFNDYPPQGFLPYTFNLTGLSSLSQGDNINYRFIASDSANGVGTNPPSGKYLKVPIVDFSPPISSYSNNFNANTNDFVGNFFKISQPEGFTNGAIHSEHNYPKGFGVSPNFYSNFTYTLIKPILISTSNPIIRFDEIVLVEGYNNGTLSDTVIVEGSKDNGKTWSEFLSGYNAASRPEWLVTYNNRESGSPALFRTRTIDMTSNGNFVPEDEVIIRFRFFSNRTGNGWGWAIDNLYIQDPITSTEKELESAISVYPNPAKENIIVEASGLSSPEFTIQLLNAQGQTVYAGSDFSVNGKMTHLISASTLPKGMYFVKITNERNTITRKVVKVD